MEKPIRIQVLDPKVTLIKMGWVYPIMIGTV
jgi:hypothetical protein